MEMYLFRKLVKKMSTLLMTQKPSESIKVELQHSFCWDGHTNESSDILVDEMLQETFEQWKSSCENKSHVVTLPPNPSPANSWDYISQAF
jgi:hypothetical protein